ncbi:MAG TPA: hypothetical protein VK524_27285 [Polyangiaceae bacterium]|nr:hypothetical protein [Polyangiaceae bacterium]
MTLEGERLGLCAACRHARSIVSSKGSRFTLCGKSLEDPRFPKYPRLPVVQCSGHLPAAEPEQPR